MWHTLDFEKQLEKYLIEKLGDDPGKTKYNEYTSVRDMLIKDNAFNAIDKAEPTLTDHSERHVADVMNRVYKLLENNPANVLTYSEYYLLAMLILFHDTGNIFGRKNHEKNAAIVYKHFAGTKDDRQERLLLTKGIAAHSGFSQNGTKDTLKDLHNNESLNGEPIRLRELAALLRFADELAEGEQRTSRFMIENGLIEKDSLIYHNYAKITDIFINPNLERISITFNIDIEKEDYDEGEIKELIDFALSRINKLDIERRYNKNYSDLLKKFKFTTVEMNITINDVLLNLDEIKMLELTDRFPIPGEVDNNNKTEIEGHFSTTTLITSINKLIN